MSPPEDESDDETEDQDEPPSQDFTYDQVGPTLPVADFAKTEDEGAPPNELREEIRVNPTDSVQVKITELELDHAAKIERERTRRVINIVVLIGIFAQFPGAAVAGAAGADWETIKDVLVLALAPFVALATLIGHYYYHSD